MNVEYMGSRKRKEEGHNSERKNGRMKNKFNINQDVYIGKVG